MWEKADRLNPLRNRRRQHLGARLALLALLLQMVVPFSQAIPAPWQTQTGMLLVCIGSGGLQTISWSSEEQPPSHFQCPICHLQASCGVGLIQPIANGPAFIVNLQLIEAPCPERVFQSGDWRSSVQPRAPPAFS